MSILGGKGGYWKEDHGRAKHLGTYRAYSKDFLLRFQVNFQVRLVAGLLVQPNNPTIWQILKFLHIATTISLPPKILFSCSKTPTRQKYFAYLQTAHRLHFISFYTFYRTPIGRVRHSWQRQLLINLSFTCKTYRETTIASLEAAFTHDEKGINKIGTLLIFALGTRLATPPRVHFLGSWPDD